jgi:hypothetical protein
VLRDIRYKPLAWRRVQVERGTRGHISVVEAVGMSFPWPRFSRGNCWITDKPPTEQSAALAARCSSVLMACQSDN